jgi:hypothetical protein
MFCNTTCFAHYVPTAPDSSNSKICNVSYQASDSTYVSIIFSSNFSRPFFCTHDFTLRDQVGNIVLECRASDKQAIKRRAITSLGVHTFAIVNDYDQKLTTIDIEIKPQYHNIISVSPLMGRLIMQYMCLQPNTGLQCDRMPFKLDAICTPRFKDKAVRSFLISADTNLPCGPYDLIINTVPPQKYSLDVSYDATTIIELPPPGSAEFITTRHIGEIQLLRRNVNNIFVVDRTFSINEALELELRPGLYQIKYSDTESTSDIETQTFIIKPQRYTNVQVDLFATESPISNDSSRIYNGQ